MIIKGLEWGVPPFFLDFVKTSILVKSQAEALKAKCMDLVVKI